MRLSSLAFCENPCRNISDGKSSNGPHGTGEARAAEDQMKDSSRGRDDMASRDQLEANSVKLLRRRAVELIGISPRTQGFREVARGFLVARICLRILGRSRR